MARTLINFTTALLFIYIAMCLVMFVFQRSFLYFPQPRSNVPGADLIKLNSDNLTINVTAVNPNNAEAILYFGGNAEDVSYSVPHLAAAFPGKALYLMHYRGYGGSEGKPSEKALIKDALALYDSISKNHSDIIVVGRSLGSGIAIQLASARQISKLVLVTPYDSMARIAATHYPFLPVKWLFQDKYESWKYAENITVPTFIIAAEHDEVIPLASTKSLFNHFRKGNAQFNIVENTGHNSISSSPEYISLLSRASVALRPGSEVQPNK